MPNERVKQFEEMRDRWHLGWSHHSPTYLMGMLYNLSIKFGTFNSANESHTLRDVCMREYKLLAEMFSEYKRRKANGNE